MTKAQNQRERILALREARDQELRMLAQGRKNANPRYVQDVVDFLWTQLLNRKLRMIDSLPAVKRRRLSLLVDIEAA